MDLTWTYNK